MKVYDEEFGLPACSAGNGRFEQVNQNGEKGKLPFPSSVGERHQAELLCEDVNAPESEREAACYAVEEADGWSLEMSLDIEMAHAVCQNCHIVLVEAEDSEGASLEAAEDTAARSRGEGGVGAGRSRTRGAVKNRRLTVKRSITPVLWSPPRAATVAISAGRQVKRNALAAWATLPPRRMSSLSAVRA